MVFQSVEAIFKDTGLQQQAEKVIISDQKVFKEKTIDSLVDTIILNDDFQVKRNCYWVAHNLANQLDIGPASIQDLYKAVGKEEVGGFTVPAMNIRTLTFESAKAVFRSAKKINAGAFIFEIAKSEIGYTFQRPLEYSSIIILAAMKEDYQGPLFFLGDHFQVKADKFKNDQDKEIKQLKNLIREAIDAQFYNIDIDSSTLVDLSKANFDQQQKLNYEVCGSFTKFIREVQPKGIEISMGGEIGEVGGKNSTPEDLEAFMQGYLREIKNLEGISKISIQTGTSHGGVILPDGSIAKVNIDFDTLDKLSEVGRRNYGIAGAVQHGASTLPNEAFHRFPQVGCAEIHLATQFQNMVYDYLPLSLKEKIYSWLHQELSSEKKKAWTDDQFIYKTRKKALGPFKKDIHSLSKDTKNRISSVLEEEFTFLFDQLNIKNTKDAVNRYIKKINANKKREDFFKENYDLGELEGAD